MNRKRILVTGASGFLGRHLLSILAGRRPEAFLFAVSRKRGDWPGRKLSGDLSTLRDARRILRTARPDLVFHLAGISPAASPRELHRTYVETTACLVQSLPEGRRPCRFIVAGSASEYGAAGGAGRPVREETEESPASAYGRSKWAQTRLALAQSRPGFEVVVGRVFNLSGPDCPGRLAPGAWSREIAAIEAGKRPPFVRVGNLERRRDLLDVRDAVRALVGLAGRGRPGEVYNVCSGVPVSMKEVLSALLSFSPLRSRIGVRVDPGLKRERALDLPCVYGSRARITRDTGWRPRVTLRQSLRETLEAARKAR